MCRPTGEEVHKATDATATQHESTTTTAAVVKCSSHRACTYQLSKLARRWEYLHRLVTSRPHRSRLDSEVAYCPYTIVSHFVKTQMPLLRDRALSLSTAMTSTNKQANKQTR
jgi:hypothetical protein